MLGHRGIFPVRVPSSARRGPPVHACIPSFQHFHQFSVHYQGFGKDPLSSCTPKPSAPLKSSPERRHSVLPCLHFQTKTATTSILEHSCRLWSLTRLPEATA